MRMDEFSIDPSVGLGAEFLFLGEDLFTPVFVIGEMDDVVIFIEEGEASREVRDEHEVFIDVNVGGEDERFREGFEVLSFKGEPLEAAIGTVGNAEAEVFRVTAIDP